MRSNDTQLDAPTYWFQGISPHSFEPLEHLPTRVEVVIVGGGFLGVSTGYWLAKLGADALLLESSHLCSGATGRNVGLMLPAATKLEDPSLLKAVLHEEGIEADYDTPGHLALASTPEVWEAFQVEVTRRTTGSPALFALEPSDCEQLLKMRVSRRFLGGRWFPQGGVVHPVKLVYGVAGCAQKHGLRISTLTPMIDVVPGGRELIVRTGRGEVATKFLIYACSAGIGDFVPELRGSIRLVKARVWSTAPLAPLFHMGMAVDWGTVYWRQAHDGTVVIGGDSSSFLSPTLLESGSRPESDGVSDAFLSAAFPDLSRVTVRRSWTGVMDSAADGRPLVGPIPNRPNQWVVTGFNGHGMPLGLSVGRSVAQSILGGKTAPALAHFNPQRLECLPQSSEVTKQDAFMSV